MKVSSSEENIWRMYEGGVTLKIDVTRDALLCRRELYICKKRYVTVCKVMWLYRDREIFQKEIIQYEVK